MGGCRCTYRNCTVKSDGQTHLFHYPVFDKARCHQWLTNAHRHDFLNLKVSQLKNRVVCQHHFRKEYFMNFMMYKLKFDAVPTENGPFCDEPDYPEPEIAGEMGKEYPITFEGIDFDLLSCNEKKANFSVKYGDFLTSCELNPFIPTIDKNTLLPEFDPVIENNINVEKNYHSTNRVPLPAVSSKIQMQPMLVVPSYSDSVHKTVNPVVLGNEHLNVEVGINPLQMGVQSSKVSSTPAVQCNSSPVKTPVMRNNRIKILSEKKITEPLPFNGKLEPVSPSFILHVPKNKNISDCKPNEKRKVMIDIEVPILTPETKSHFAEVQSEKPLVEVQNIQNNTASLLRKVNIQNSQTSPLKNVQNQTKPSIQTSPSVKTHIPPERIAAIAEKRNFNKKLRDMIEFCLDELDDQDKKMVSSDLRNKLPIKQDQIPIKKVSTIEENLQLKSKSHEIESKKISKPLDLPQRRSLIKKDNSVSQNLKSNPNEQSMPSMNEYNLAFLDARIKRMEDTLLKRIDQNSQNIIDLKNSLPSVSTKKSTFKPTPDNEESHKRKLYHEISKFLSPQANSLIYEELFINRYVPNTPACNVDQNPLLHTPTPKRRKRR